MKSLTKQKNRGSAYLLAIISFTLLSGIAATIHHATGQEYSVNHVRKSVEICNNSAESGLVFYQDLFNGMRSNATFGKLPDIRGTVVSYLRSKLTSAGVNVHSKNGGDLITVDPITIGDIKFTAEFEFTDYIDDTPTNLGSAFNSNHTIHKVPSKMVATITGYKDGTTRRLKTEFAITVDSNILKYAISSAVRVALRGKVLIKGDIFSTWDRTYSNAYAFDIGHSDRWERDKEDIQITGKIISSLDKNRFIHDSSWLNGIRYKPIRDRFYDQAPNISSRQGAAENPYYDEGKEAQDKFEWGREDVTKITHDDINTHGHRDATSKDLMENCNVQFDRDRNKYMNYGQWAQGFLSNDGKFYRYKSGKWLDEHNKSHGSSYHRPSGVNGVKGSFYYSNNSGHMLFKTRQNSKHAYNGYVYYAVPKAKPGNISGPNRVRRYTRWGSRHIWRDVVGNHNDHKTKTEFNNLKIPAGSNAHFKNCTFKGITYIETNESQYALSGSRFRSGTANNVVFENCKFEGPVITGTPKHFRFIDNAITFEGNTEFVGSEIKKVANGVTVLAPNFNVNIGDLDQSSNASVTKLEGVVLAGLIDIRDNAHIKGTLINMADFGHLSNYQVGAGWASNIGNCEQGGETIGGRFVASENIIIEPDPDNVLPMGFKRRYLVKAIPGSYQELGN